MSGPFYPVPSQSRIVPRQATTLAGSATPPAGTHVQWNPSDKHADIVLSNNNLTATHDGASADTWIVARATRAHSVGKYYFEQKWISGYVGMGLALASSTLSNFLGSAVGSAGYYTDGNVWVGGGSTATGAAIASDEWGGLAVDFDAGKAWVRNITGWIGDPEAGTGNTISFTPNSELFAACVLSLLAGASEVTANFGGSAFAYTIPSGFIAWDEYEVTAGSASFAFTGSDITVNRTYILGADSGSFAFTGTDVTFDRTYILEAGSGSFAFTGTDVALTKGYVLNADTDSFVFTGTDITVNRTYILAADSGSFAFSGTDITVDRTYILAADSGSFAFTGTDVDLTITTVGAYTIDVDNGAFVFTGDDITVDRTYILAADSAEFLFSGTDISLDRTYVLEAGSGEFLFTGDDVTLDYAPVAVETARPAEVFWPLTRRNRRLQEEEDELLAAIREAEEKADAAKSARVIKAIGKATDASRGLLGEDGLNFAILAMRLEAIANAKTSAEAIRAASSALIEARRLQDEVEEEEEAMILLLAA